MKPTGQADPMQMLRDQRLRKALVAAIKGPEREQYVMKACTTSRT